MKTEVFKDESQMIIGNKMYIIERHFQGVRELTKAFGIVIKNADKQKQMSGNKA